MKILNISHYTWLVATVLESSGPDHVPFENSAVRCQDPATLKFFHFCLFIFFIERVFLNEIYRISISAITIPISYSWLLNNASLNCLDPLQCAFPPINVFSLPSDFLNYILFSIAYFKNTACNIYITNIYMCVVNQMFTLSVRLPVNHRLLVGEVLRRQKLCTF